MVMLLSSEEMSADEVYKFILAEVKADRKQKHGSLQMQQEAAKSDSSSFEQSKFCFCSLVFSAYFFITYASLLLIFLNYFL